MSCNLKKFVVFLKNFIIVINFPHNLFEVRTRDGPLFFSGGRGGGGYENIEKKLFAGPKKTK